MSCLILNLAFVGSIAADFLRSPTLTYNTITVRHSAGKSEGIKMMALALMASVKGKVQSGSVRVYNFILTLFIVSTSV